MNITKLIAFAILGSCVASNAVIKYASRWEKASHGKMHALSLLGDRHTCSSDYSQRESLLKVDKEQRELIANHAEHLRNTGKTVFFIIEDSAMHAYTTYQQKKDDDEYREGLELEGVIKGHGCSPIALTHLLNSLSIPAYNAEFRTPLHLSQEGFLSTNTLLCELEKIVFELEAYHDTDALGEYYAKIVATARATFKEIKALTSNTRPTLLHLQKSERINPYITGAAAGLAVSPLITYATSKPESQMSYCLLAAQIALPIGYMGYIAIDRYETKKRTEIVKQLRKINYSLIEARMLHKLYEQQNNYDEIFIAAGSAHIRAIEKMLPLLGYCSVDSRGVHDSTFTPANLRRFFSSRPESIPTNALRPVCLPPR